MMKNLTLHWQWLLDFTLFIYTLSETFLNNSGKNPHKHLAHKVSNKDLDIDLDIWLKHLI